MSENLLDGNDVHAVAVEVGGSEVPQHVRLELADLARQMPDDRLGEPGPQSVVLLEPSPYLHSEGNSGGKRVVDLVVEVPARPVTHHSSRSREPLLSGTSRSFLPRPWLPLPLRRQS